MRRARRWVRTHRPVTALAAATAFLAVFAVALGVAGATDRPAFCGATCHEMAPFHSAWQDGAHSSVSCIDCHVDAGIPARLSHKVVAVKEVWTHVTGAVRFPLSTPAVVPDERCVKCHTSISVAVPGFDHERHAQGGSCVSCHAQTGHLVDDQTLANAGLLNVAAVRKSDAATGFAVVDGGAANLPDHISVSCSRCHDMAATGCGRCHDTNHEEGGATKSGPCHLCHSTNGGFAFSHPRGAEIVCVDCHARPEKHRGGDCQTCHKAGVDWSFRHPRRGAVCTSCHERPSSHRGGACTTCHRRVGTSWSFTHPTSSDCAACHNVPARHYGTVCASCHSRTTPWRSARFGHPRIPGGEHSYRSFPCASCHPNGFSTAVCTRCHNGSGGEDDD